MKQNYVPKFTLNIYSTSRVMRLNSVQNWREIE